MEHRGHQIGKDLLGKTSVLHIPEESYSLKKPIRPTFHTDIRKPFSGKEQQSCPRLLSCREDGRDVSLQMAISLPWLLLATYVFPNGVTTLGKYEKKKTKNKFNDAMLLFLKGHQGSPL